MLEALQSFETSSPADEKYFSLTGDVSCNRRYYTTDSFTAPPKVNYKTKMKFEPKLFVWMAVSHKGVSSIYVHRSAKDTFK